jgi:hypothetical protein
MQPAPSVVQEPIKIGIIYFWHVTSPCPEVKADFTRI